ncbi:MAG TPA: ThuA domain-containing protein [Planctomycetota bacterium]|nr:ThuA domain-containing protein [Planctomycetota bacterium]
MNPALAVVLSAAAGAFALGIALGCAGPSGAAPPAAPAGAPAGGTTGPGRDRSGPLRVLVLSGGGYHDFDGNLKLLLDGLPVPAGTHWSFLSLGDDSADGVSRALRLRQLESLELPGEHDVILAYTQGELGLSPTAKDKLLAFVRGGGGFVGLHCAADSHPGWAEYTAMLGGRFESHPPYGEVTVQLTPAAERHPVTRGLPDRWSLKDEFYHLTDLQLGDATLLMTGVSPAGGEPRPVAWAKPYGQGRVMYTILGHGPEAHSDARYRKLVAQALLWAGGRE